MGTFIGMSDWGGIKTALKQILAAARPIITFGDWLRVRACLPPPPQRTKILSHNFPGYYHHCLLLSSANSRSLAFVIACAGMSGLRGMFFNSCATGPGIHTHARGCTHTHTDSHTILLNGPQSSESTIFESIHTYSKKMHHCRPLTLGTPRNIVRNS